MQCKLIANKQKIINQLIQQNKYLQNKLEQYLSSHQQSVQQAKNLKNQHANLISILDAQNLKSQLLDSAIDSLANQINQQTQQHKQLKQQLTNISQQNKVTNQKLYRQSQDLQQLQLLVDRMNKQLKTNLNLQKGGNSNMIKICQQKKKKLDASVKTIQILNSKYQSLYKFLNVLRNKKQKQQQKRIAQHPKTVQNRISKNLGFYPKENYKIGKSGNSTENVKIVTEKQKLRKIQTETRKRNFILMNNKKL